MAIAIPIPADRSERLWVSPMDRRPLGQVILASLSNAKREIEFGLGERSAGGGKIDLLVQATRRTRRDLRRRAVLRTFLGKVPEFTHGWISRAGQRHGVCGAAHFTFLHRLHPLEDANPQAISASMVSLAGSSRYCP